MKLKIILFTIILLLITACSSPKKDDVQLIHVIDGDTIVVRQHNEQFKVRLLLIDTPEMTYGKHEAYSKQAKQQLEQLLTEAQTIRLEYEPNNLTDKYGRHLAYVFADDTLTQAVLIEHGYAKVKYIRTHHERYLQQLLDLQSQAQKQKKGIWHIQKKPL